MQFLPLNCHIFLCIALYIMLPLLFMTLEEKCGTYKTQLCVTSTHFWSACCKAVAHACRVIAQFCIHQRLQTLLKVADSSRTHLGTKTLSDGAEDSCISMKAIKIHIPLRAFQRPAGFVSATTGITRDFVSPPWSTLLAPCFGCYVLIKNTCTQYTIDDWSRKLQPLLDCRDFSRCNFWWRIRSGTFVLVTFRWWALQCNTETCYWPYLSRHRIVPLLWL